MKQWLIKKIESIKNDLNHYQPYIRYWLSRLE